MVGLFAQTLGRPEEKAEYLGTCFEQQFARNPPNDWDFDEQIRDEVDACLAFPICTVPEPISRKEVTDRLAELRPRKAAGPDGVTNSALQRLPEQGVLQLVALFNACLSLTYFPGKWKKATVIAIPKQAKDPSRADGLRPISFLSATSKVFERLVKPRLLDHLARFEVLVPERFGFRLRHSSTHQLMPTVEYIAGSGCKGKQTAAIFLDIEQAFERVWHEGLLYKLKEVQRSRTATFI